MSGETTLAATRAVDGEVPTVAEGACGSVATNSTGFAGRVVDSSDPQIQGRKAEGAENAAYEAAYRSCTRRKDLEKPAVPEGPSEILSSVATLAAAASHEINNPLMAIIASLELLERTQTLDAYGHARLAVALAAAGKIEKTIRQLGRITRLELAAGGANLPPMLDLEKSSPGANDGPEWNGGTLQIRDG